MIVSKGAVGARQQRAGASGRQPLVPPSEISEKFTCFLGHVGDTCTNPYLVVYVCVENSYSYVVRV